MEVDTRKFMASSSSPCLDFLDFLSLFSVIKPLPGVQGGRGGYISKIYIYKFNPSKSSNKQSPWETVFLAEPTNVSNHKSVKWPFPHPAKPTSHLTWRPEIALGDPFSCWVLRLNKTTVWLRLVRGRSAMNFYGTACFGIKKWYSRRLQYMECGRNIA